MIRSLVFSLLLVVLFMSGSTFAQTPKPNKPVKLNEQEIRPTSPIRMPRQLSPFDDKMRLIRRLVSTRNYSGAMAMLETLYEEKPDDNQVINLLQVCYRQLKLYFKMEAITRRRLEQYPNNLSFQLTLSEMICLQGNVKDGLVEYQKAINLVIDKDQSRVLIVIRSLMAQGFEDEAFELIVTTRKRLDQPNLFGISAGAIQEKKKEYEAAFAEYLPLLREDTTRPAADAERKIVALLAFGESSQVIEGVLLAEVENSHSTRLLNLVSSHYLKEGRFDDATELAIRQDSLERDNGQSLLFFMQQCSDHDAHKPIVRVAEYFLIKYPKAAYRRDVLNKFGTALAETGQIDSAIVVFSEVARRSAGNSIGSTALHTIGLIYLEQLNDPNRALIYFDSVLNRPQRGRGYLLSLKDIPESYMQLGDTKTAGEKYRDLKTFSITDDIAEEVDFNLGLIQFYNKQYDSAKVSFKKLMVDYPKGLYVNDALKIMMLINRSEGSGDDIYQYSTAHLFRRMKQPDSVEARLTILTESNSAVLADIALYEISLTKLEQADTTSALMVVESLIERFPESYYTPYGMKMKADFLMDDPRTLEEATGIYSLLLREHPNYPFISDVRKRMRGLNNPEPSS